MGWTSWGNEHRSTDEILRQTYEKVGHRILATATVGDTWYAALQPKDESFVTALVVLFRKGSSSFACKEMDESMGPTESRCPARILRLLSPVEQLPYAGFATAWRERCQQALRRAA